MEKAAKAGKVEKAAKAEKVKVKVIAVAVTARILTQVIYVATPWMIYVPYWIHM